MTEFFASLPLCFEWWSPLAILVAFILVVMLLQLIGIIDEPTRVNFKIMELYIRSEYLIAPLRRIIHKRTHDPGSAFRIISFSHSIGDSLEMQIEVENASPCPVIGQPRFTFELWHTKSDWRSGKTVETLNWTPPRQNIVLTPSDKLSVRLPNQSWPERPLRVMIAKIDGDIRWY